MQQFQAIFPETKTTPVVTLSFEAPDLSQALARLGPRFAAKPLELWSEGRRLGFLEMIAADQGQVWRLG